MERFRKGDKNYYRKSMQQHKFIIIPQAIDLSQESINIINNLKRDMVFEDSIFQHLGYNCKTQRLNPKTDSNDEKRKQRIIRIRECSPYDVNQLYFDFITRMSEVAYEFVTQLFSNTSIQQPSYVSVLYSEKGCMEQDLHYDYDPTDEMARNCYACILFLEDDSALVIQNGNEKLLQKFNKGDIVIFRGDKPHGGASYPDNDNVRLHYYFDIQGFIREDDATYIVTAEAPNLNDFLSFKEKWERKHEKKKKRRLQQQLTMQFAFSKKFK